MSVHHHHHFHMPLRHGWVKFLIKDFETNPAVQYRIHMTFTYIWLVNMAVALAVFIFAPRFWQTASVLYLVLVSLYANFATDYGAVSAAIAAGTAKDIPPPDRPPPS
jgi:hypothetical protein